MCTVGVLLRGVEFYEAPKSAKVFDKPNAKRGEELLCHSLHGCFRPVVHFHKYDAARGEVGGEALEESVVYMPYFSAVGDSYLRFVFQIVEE